MKAPVTKPLVRPDGTLITERDIQQGLRVSMTASCFGMMWVVTALGIPLTLMLQSLKASGVLIGTSTMIQQLAMVAQIPASYLTERFIQRKKIWGVLAVLHRLVWFIPAVLPFLFPDNWALMATLIVVVVGVSSVLGQASTPLWYSWMVELIPDHLSARFWARRQSYVMAFYLLCTIGVGYILDAFPDPQTKGGSFLGFAIVFGIGACFGVADILIHLRVPEPKPHPVKRGASLWRRVIAPLQAADFRWFSLSMGVWTFAIGLVASFSIICLRRDFHFTYVQITIVTMAGSLGAVLAGFQSGYVIDRLGARTYAAALMLIAPATALVWFFMLDDTRVEYTLPLVGLISISQPLLLQLVVSVAAGALYSSIGLCQIRLLSTLSPTEGRTMAMGAHWTIVGITGALGPVLAGWIMDWYDKHPVEWIMVTGTKFSFFHILVLIFLAIAWAVAAPFMLQVSRNRGDLPFGEALPRLWLGNPLRAVRNVYNIYAVTAVVSARDRVQAVRSLGTGRVTLAVSDLIANLDDPSYDVREAAVFALGNMESAEATRALVTRLDSPECDLHLHIIRALRQSKLPDAVDALIRQLDNEDSEISAEAARTLGLLHNNRAAESLLALLARTNNDKVFLAAAEALSRLEEPELLPSVIARIEEEPGQLLRKSLFLVVADVLGQPGEFYKILGEERENPNDVIQGLLANLRHLEIVTDELANHIQQLFESGDTAACLRSLVVICQTTKPVPTVENLVSYWVRRADKPATTEILLALYLLGHPPADRQ